MPELPEVETIVRDIRPHLVGRRFTGATLTHADVLRGVSRRRLLASLPGARVRDVFRRAKHAVIDLGEARLVVQPGMTGGLVIHRREPRGEAARYNVLTVRLDRGGVLVYRDVRRLGTVLLLAPKAWERYHAAIGPEPLAPGFTPDAFRDTLAKSRQAIKKVLMDQRRLAGVGNIYANEALFAAGIDPSKPANRIDPEGSARLYREVRRILAAAIEAEGTTVRDYQTGTGQPGNFQLELFVYGRAGEPCRICGTRLAETHTIDARQTVFCHRCQR
ncbi:MAG: bifunctional DNA-formamidopyrimidine glycosylase/DNA-(apurinic or apyrimidinic site) lyase [Gemmatimonadales bacterium]